MAKDSTAKVSEVQRPKIIWDDSKMGLNYANVCNVSTTREEFNLLFGTNQNWNASKPEVLIELSNRIVLNPSAAKRMSILLANAIAQYEEKVGPIQIETENSSNLQ